LLRKYLESRGLSYIPKGLFFHPSLSYTYNDGAKVDLPAMLAMVQGLDGSAVTIHRTYLDPITGKKADVERPKMLMSKPSTKSLKGAAIRLATVYGDLMGVAEGIETSIAAIEATGMPVWATVAAHFMEQFTPPDHVKRVIVFADKDLSNTGQTSAQRLVERLWAMGVKASIELPPTLIPEGAKGIDWLDEWNLHGKLNFPKAA
jgi:putative DNA primase/helicase